MKLKIYPSKIEGSAVIPPSKSYAIRYIVAAFLSGRDVTLHNVGESEDVKACIGAVKALGADISTGENSVRILKRNEVKEAVVDCGECALVYRILLPVVAALGIKTRFILSDSLARRPHEDIIAALNSRKVKCDGETVEGTLSGGDFKIDCSLSSQFLTGLALALPLIGGSVEIVGKAVSMPYFDITLDVMAHFGVKPKLKNGAYVFDRCDYRAKTGYEIEGDWSSAAYLFAACYKKGVTVFGLNENSLQGDASVVGILKDFGFSMTVGDGKVTARVNDKLKGVAVDCTDIPDLVPALSIVAARAEGITRLENVSRLRYKESDRIVGITKILRSFGMKYVFEGEDLVVFGSGKLVLNEDTFDAAALDHRTVMTLVIAALLSEGERPVIIDGAERINKSYPTFVRDIALLGGKADVLL